MRLPPGWRTITREGRNEPEQGVPSPELVAQNALKERPLSLQIRFRCRVHATGAIYEIASNLKSEKALSSSRSRRGTA